MMMPKATGKATSVRTLVSRPCEDMRLAAPRLYLGRWFPRCPLEGAPPARRMRRFATVSHTGRSDGEWHLNDLSAKAGRIDLLCRNIQSAFFLSHGLREDVEFYAVFAESALRQKTVRLQGNAIQMLHPDERSTAARLQQALQAAWSVPDWKEVQRGLAVARFGLEGLLDDL